MLIPTGMVSRTFTGSGTVVKECDCARCNLPFYYVVKAVATGESSSFLGINRTGTEAQAQVILLKNLDMALERAIEPAPCPRCGLIPDATVRSIRKIRIQHDAVLMILVLATVIAGVAAAASETGRNALGQFGPLGLCLALTGWRLATILRYDPNQGPRSDKIKVYETRQAAEADDARRVAPPKAQE